MNIIFVWCLLRSLALLDCNMGYTSFCFDLPRSGISPILDHSLNTQLLACWFSFFVWLCCGNISYRTPLFNEITIQRFILCMFLSLPHVFINYNPNNCLFKKILISSILNSWKRGQMSLGVYKPCLDLTKHRIVAVTIKQHNRPEMNMNV